MPQFTQVNTWLETHTAWTLNAKKPFRLQKSLVHVTSVADGCSCRIAIPFVALMMLKMVLTPRAWKLTAVRRRHVAAHRGIRICRSGTLNSA